MGGPPPGPFLLVLVLGVLGVSVFPPLVAATVFKVGDNLGWTLNVNYTQWASQYNFVLGDSVVFVFGGSHSALMVEEIDYVLCNIHNPLQVIQSGSPVLLAARKNFFICGVPGHCITGMKVAIYPSIRVTSPASMGLASRATPQKSSPLLVVMIFLLLMLIGLPN